MENIQVVAFLREPSETQKKPLYCLSFITGQFPNHSKIKITTDPDFTIEEIPLKPGQAVEPFLTLNPEMFHALAKFFDEYNKQTQKNWGK
jgi:hypothetical protein